MLKKINRLLKLVGLNLVHAKRKQAIRRPYTREELENCPPPRKLHDNMTHFVGDDCPGGHRDLEGPTGNVGCCGGPVGVDDHERTRVEQPNSDNKIGGPTS